MESVLCLLFATSGYQWFIGNFLFPAFQLNTPYINFLSELLSRWSCYFLWFCLMLFYVLHFTYTRHCLVLFWILWTINSQGWCWWMYYCILIMLFIPILCSCWEGSRQVLCKISSSTSAKERRIFSWRLMYSTAKIFS